MPQDMMYIGADSMLRKLDEVLRKRREKVGEAVKAVGERTIIQFADKHPEPPRTMEEMGDILYPKMHGVDRLKDAGR